MTTEAFSRSLIKPQVLSELIIRVTDIQTEINKLWELCVSTHIYIISILYISSESSQSQIVFIMIVISLLMLHW